ncbi:LutB/LldF family L-lactate oxidation iron-sulfur protein [Paracoccus aerodenitrificans]|uniref:LutB/LldF family L-lactate oxidation iron-sulfur protein n=1 Tax=Paracoccus aerodenitrificans TaxID=3017781 RepID=UPI0022F05803|nr:LutB/LldF family L-lactate oxidation iron-sulfur protein [Paracoccus aerodenitrificans]WBU62817.1 LutB/LldF family L-lactate oxidation iron-sulfur protein [Paracoccus aerodenitrificans]
MTAAQIRQGFRQRATTALNDANLKVAINRTTGTAETKRAASVGDFPEFQAARDRAAAIKDHVIANLDHYLAEFERNAIAAGAHIHWVRGASEAASIVTRICKDAGAKRVTRSKSMLGEEIGLPHALDDAGIERVETDLAEHIIQLAGERPSHIIWPAMHRTREDVAVLFQKDHHPPPVAGDAASMVASARNVLRGKFLSADVGISGANFLVADTGATCTVTNEGNAELSTTPPRVHIVTAGIEKLVPSTDHAMALLRVLVRSATGGEVTQYTTFHCGPKRQGDADGPEEMHIVLVDNGRSRMLGDEFRTMLRCIRCGACMNHCVVYRQIGGHAYGGTYPGPMGAVLTPVLDGLAKSRDLPFACTLNGRCEEVCPVRIPLKTLLKAWRFRSWDSQQEVGAMRFGLGLWGFAARRPRLYRFGTRIALPLMRLFGRDGWIIRMPFDKGWTQTRDLPRPASRSFMSQHRKYGNKGPE